MKIKQDKYTAGEWKIEDNTDHEPFIVDSEDRLIAKLFEDRAPKGLFYGRTHEENAANAKLICAAPEMLALLRNIDIVLIPHNSATRIMAKKIKSIIKKAT